jgi:hypothetical protein
MKMSKTPLTQRGHSLIPNIIIDMAAKSNLTGQEHQTLIRLCMKLFPEDRVRKWIADQKLLEESMPLEK